MTKTISKSKRQLAQLLIEAGVTQFPDGANWAAQGGGEGRVGFCVDKQVRDGIKWRANSDSLIRLVEVASRIPNWHQTVLSRDEFDQIVAETEPRSTAVGDDETNLAAKEELEALEFTPSPTLDQLLQDWRNADDYAQRKQTEADEAAAMRDERWQMVQARAGEMGVIVGQCEPVVVGRCEPVKIGDEVIAARVVSVERLEGRKGKVLKIDSTAYHGPLLVKFPDDGTYWVKEWQLARP